MEQHWAKIGHVFCVIEVVLAKMLLIHEYSTVDMIVSTNLFFDQF